jgi:hypothetical protein
LSLGGVSVFHPNGNEIIINNEIWDLRTFKLLKSCSKLSNSQKILFDSNQHVFYVSFSEGKNLQIMDSTNYNALDSYDMEKFIMDFDVDRFSNKLGNSSFSLRLALLFLSKDDVTKEAQLVYMGEMNDEQEEEQEEEEEEGDIHDPFFEEDDSFMDDFNNDDFAFEGNEEDVFSVDEALNGEEDDYLEEEEEEEDDYLEDDLEEELEQDEDDDDLEQ